LYHTDERTTVGLYVLVRTEGKYNPVLKHVLESITFTCVVALGYSTAYVITYAYM